MVRADSNFSATLFKARIADVEHWHGAAPDSWFSHLGVECNPGTNQNTWLEAVSEADYEAATDGK